jgi:hypothetical protein
MHCQICLEAYNIYNRIPKNLFCGHTYCERCLKRVGNGYEIECPKCRQKSKNNLPICHAIYDDLLLEEITESEDYCPIHEYENLLLYCHEDKIAICTVCLNQSHSGHSICLLKEKILADNNKKVLTEWGKYFLAKRDEFEIKKEKLLGLSKDIEGGKMALMKETSLGYENIIQNFKDIKHELFSKNEDLFKSESEQIKNLKIQIDQYINDIEEFLNKNDKVDTLIENNEIMVNSISLFKNKNRLLNKFIENLLAENMQMKFYTLKFSEDFFFKKNDITVESLININENTFKNHIIFMGDSKDKTILDFNLAENKFTKITETVGNNFEFLDYSTIISYKNNFLLIAGGCFYSNFKNTASNKTYIAKLTNDNKITILDFKPLNFERFSHGCCILNGSVYVFGGHNGFNTLSSTEYFDEKEMVWKQAADMVMEREIFGYCAVRGRYAYVFGGFNETHLDSIERYDAVRNKWKTLDTKLKIPLQNCTAVTVSDDLIALIGGYSGSFHRSIFLFNITGRNWNSVDYCLKVARRKSHCFIYDDKVTYVNNLGVYIWR